LGFPIVVALVVESSCQEEALGLHDDDEDEDEKIGSL